MDLLQLPIELLLTLPQYLHNIEDFTNLSSTSRVFRKVCSDASPNTLLRLAAASSRIFFRPDPHFLIAATVRQLSDWALLNSDNAEVLRQAIHGGIYTLLALSVDKAGLTMEDIRCLRARRSSLLNPISDMIDRCAGPNFVSTPNFWNGGVSNPI